MRAIRKQKERYFAENGVLQSEIVIDSNGFLRDGFTSFLIAQKQIINGVTNGAVKG